MEQAIVELSNQGIGVVCVVFMIYFINTTMKENNKTLDSVRETLVAIQTTLLSLTNRVDEIENKLRKEER